MLKRSVAAAALLVAAIVHAHGLFAQAPTPWIGVWEVNLAKS